MNGDNRLTIRDKLPLLVLVTAVVFCAILLSFVREPVFFLDGGMKLLATQQFANGVFTSEVRLPAETWVKRLWERGYYPLEPPFVFPLDGAIVFGQPLIFPAATAPFYAFFGYRGLYVLPVVSFLLLAIGMHVGARRIGLSPSVVAIAHAGWVTSYLTLYSAIFWEHIPGTMLAVWGIVPVVEGLSPREPPSAERGGSAHGWQRLVSARMPRACCDRHRRVAAHRGAAFQPQRVGHILRSDPECGRGFSCLELLHLRECAGHARYPGYRQADLRDGAFA